MTHPIVARLVAGGVVTYRQLDYWCRRGWLLVPSEGSGSARAWPTREVRVAEAMAHLVRAGLRPDVAARVSREVLDTSVDDQLTRSVTLYESESVRLVASFGWWPTL